MNKEQQQFFALLRAGLWGTTVDADIFSGHIDWETIFTHADQQTVLGLVAEGINTLPVEYQPSAPLLNKIRSRLTSGIRTHSLLNRTLVEVVNILDNNGIHSVLLKGQGVAMNYPEPTRRQCGDIDLYIGKDNYERACALVSSDEHAIDNEIHYHFTYNGVVIELHRIAEQLPSPWQNRHFQRWTMHHLYGNKLRRVEIDNTEIKLPPVDFDALYIFSHLWCHFSVGGGVGLRQLCDWVRYLHTFNGEIDREELRRNLKAFGLWRAWKIFAYIAVNVLGLSEKEFPFYDPSYTHYGKEMLKSIEQGGNFGLFNSSRVKRPEGYIAGKLHTLNWMSKRFVGLFSAYPLQIPTIWSRYIYTGLRQVVLDKLPTKK